METLSIMSRRAALAGIGLGALGLALSPIPTVVGHAQVAMAVEDEVKSTERQRIEAMLAHNAEQVGAVTADDFEFITPLGTVQTRDMFVGGIASGVIDNHVLEPVGPMRVRAYTDSAAVRYQARSELTVDDVEYALDLWFTAIYEIRGGGWKIVWLQATELPAE